eukprot:gnl/MRDRNA2_/MRDRNA2_61151_c0_seq2.p1 gnl/MRDRNA2_/MRDRNA2_61151_c0~~gnl/MRDRNA2_/MRDRNA2_61151_c0_seq2.p1  ORF type:complete len:416 (-),score=61.36 gnl/MRDRNA2_/MRDRNA2_61151_c0_seq2:106-1278(-)
MPHAENQEALRRVFGSFDPFFNQLLGNDALGLNPYPFDLQSIAATASLFRHLQKPFKITFAGVLSPLEYAFMMFANGRGLLSLEEAADVYDMDAIRWQAKFQEVPLQIVFKLWDHDIPGVNLLLKEILENGSDPNAPMYPRMAQLPFLRPGDPPLVWLLRLDCEVKYSRVHWVSKIRDLAKALLEKGASTEKLNRRQRRRLSALLEKGLPTRNKRLELHRSLKDFVRHRRSFCCSKVSETKKQSKRKRSLQDFVSHHRALSSPEVPVTKKPSGQKRSSKNSFSHPLRYQEVCVTRKQLVLKKSLQEFVRHRRSLCCDEETSQEKRFKMQRSLNALVGYQKDLISKPVSRKKKIAGLSGWMESQSDRRMSFGSLKSFIHHQHSVPPRKFSV